MTCQQYKPSQQAQAGHMLTHIAEEPWATVCADFIGPLPRSTHGNTVLLVFVDKFSKWVELIPLRQATTAAVKKGFRERILTRFGVPKVIITDNGAQFTSKILAKYFESIGVKQQFTAPYSPQENPTERANRTIKTMIAQFAGDNHRTWYEYLPELAFAINTSIMETTNYSPAFLIQGRDPRPPRTTYDDHTRGTGQRLKDAGDRADKMKEIFELVRLNLSKATQEQARHYNLRCRHWEPEVGQQILIKNHTLSRVADIYAAKLAPKYDGPYTTFKSPVIIEARDPISNTVRTAHVKELKPFLSAVPNS